MAYNGNYLCPVVGCGFEIENVTASYYVADPSVPGGQRLVPGNSSAARQTMLGHGETVHTLNWIGTGNEAFVPVVPPLDLVPIVDPS